MSNVTIDKTWVASISERLRELVNQSIEQARGVPGHRGTIVHSQGYAGAQGIRAVAEATKAYLDWVERTAGQEGETEVVIPDAEASKIVRLLRKRES